MKGRRGDKIMDSQYYEEMKDSFQKLSQSGVLDRKRVFLFGHCSAAEELEKLFQENGYSVIAVLDNNTAKHGKVYHGIPVVPPNMILSEAPDKAVVCIVTRFYEAMYAQLRSLGFTGEIRKHVDYNKYSEYYL